jgi:uncharacterized OsmC-like protein
LIAGSSIGEETPQDPQPASFPGGPPSWRRPGRSKPLEDAMADPCAIRASFERNVQLLALKPSRGQLRCATKARLIDGLRCEIEEGPWKLAADMPAKVGGDDTAPTPGVLGRGALASCLTIGIASWAARLGVPIDSLEVEVQTDFDARGELGFGGVPAGYSEVRYLVSIESTAARVDLDRLLDMAERHSPYLDVFGRAMALTRALRVNGIEA